jgi:hypothetical protein
LSAICPTFVTLIIIGVPSAPDASLGRVWPLGMGSDDAQFVQLFFAVCAMNPLNCGTTLSPWHLGHVGFVFSRSEIVMMSSNGFLHVSQRNS